MKLKDLTNERAAIVRKNLANFRARARRRGWRVQVSQHGAGKYSAQAFDSGGKMVRNDNL